MFPGMNPRKMQQMMKQLGVKQVDLEAAQVIIKLQDKQLIFENPEVSKVNMMGKETYQIVGKPREESLDTTPEINQDDIKTVAEQANVSEEKAKEILEKNNGDIAASILELTPQ